MMTDFTMFYKTAFDVATDWPDDEWDLFISAYNNNERVTAVFDRVTAHEKHWLVHPEYNYTPAEHPTGSVFAPASWREADFLLEYFTSHDSSLVGKKLCVDITGFMRPHVLLMLYYLRGAGVTSFEVLYSEPRHYSQKEKTLFSDGPVREIRQVAGFEGSHVPDTSNDVLILGSGYDIELMKAIAEDKANTRKIQVFGFPSLRPEMYQENILQASLVTEAVGPPGDQPYNHFAPASDPFVTATVLSDIVREERAVRKISNLYLCPTGTKAQVLGFGLYYLSECIDKPVSIVFPFRASYARDTSKGIGRTWKYTIEF